MESLETRIYFSLVLTSLSLFLGSLEIEESQKIGIYRTENPKISVKFNELEEDFLIFL